MLHGQNSNLPPESQGWVRVLERDLLALLDRVSTLETKVTYLNRKR